MTGVAAAQSWTACPFVSDVPANTKQHVARPHQLQQVHQVTQEQLGPVAACCSMHTWLAASMTASTSFGPIRGVAHDMNLKHCERTAPVVVARHTVHTRGRMPSRSSFRSSCGQLACAAPRDHGHVLSCCCLGIDLGCVCVLERVSYCAYVCYAAHTI